MGNRGGRGEHKSVEGGKGKTAICAWTSGSKGSLIRIIRGRGGRETTRHEEVRSLGGCKHMVQDVPN